MIIFKVKVFSTLIYSIVATAIALSGMAIGVYMALTHANDMYFFFLILIGLSSLVFVPDLLSSGLIEWSFGENEIKITWLKSFLLCKKYDQLITWQDIEEYKFEPQRQFSFFQLRLRDNRTLKYWHSNRANEDDFDEFLSYFQKQVVNYNEEGINILHAIRRSKTIYETPRGIMLAIILGVLMISFPILFVVLPHRKVSWIYIIPAYSGGIYFISQVISYKRKKNSSSI